MYQKIIDFDRSGGLLLVAKLNLALADPAADLTAPAQAMRGLMDRAVAAAPEDAEVLQLDTFQGVFTSCAGDAATKKKRLEGIFPILFGGNDFYALPLLLDVYSRFGRYRADFKAVEELDALYDLSLQAGGTGVLSYLIRREALNLLMRSAAFATRLPMVRTLVSDLERFPPAVRSAGDKLGGDLFFYEKTEAVA